ncbi:flagellar motor protein MotB [Myxococcota bacterium]|nr:flagellar motor protein MotB [Myxococcota bacterium]
MSPLRRPDEHGAESPSIRDRWLLSYADFLTLLLALFVVLYASARLDAERNRGLFEGLQSAFTVGANPEQAAAAPQTEVGRVGGSENATPREAIAVGSLAPLKQLEASLAEQVERERTRLRRDPGVSIHPTERGLVISLAAAEYFPAGGAEIPPERRRLLAAIAPLLAAETGSLHFEGHTDDRPVAKGAFPSNWELSSARAAAVARYFIEEHGIDPERVATTGYAAYRPLVEADSPALRARNRRVEIVVLADGEFVESRRRDDPERELGRLLEKLPPIPAELDESLRPASPGPAPFDIPLP